jgi:hypothetical protein
VTKKSSEDGIEFALKKYGIIYTKAQYAKAIIFRNRALSLNKGSALLHLIGQIIK